MPKQTMKRVDVKQGNAAKRKGVLVRLDHETWKRLRFAAIYQDMTVQDFVENLIRDALDHLDHKLSK